MEVVHTGGRSRTKKACNQCRFAVLPEACKSDWLKQQYVVSELLKFIAMMTVLAIAASDVDLNVVNAVLAPCNAIH